MEGLSTNSRRISEDQYGNSKGLTKNYVDKKCLLCSIKYVSMKKNIHILNSMILQFLNLTTLWNSDVVSWRDILHSVRIASMYLNVFSYWHYLLKEIRKVNATQYNSTNAHSYKVVMYIKSYITFVIHPPLKMAQSWTESTWEITNYGRFINQFPPNIIRSIRLFERINKKICWQKISIIFNQIYIYIYIYIYLCVCVCVCVYVCDDWITLMSYSLGSYHVKLQDMALKYCGGFSLCLSFYSGLTLCPVSRQKPFLDLPLWVGWVCNCYFILMTQ